MKLCNLFCNYSEYRKKKKKQPVLNLISTQESNTFNLKTKQNNFYIEGSIGNHAMSNIYPFLADKVLCEVRNKMQLEQ